MRGMVGRSDVASVAPVLPDQHGAKPCRKSAEKFPKAKFPPLDDYNRACASLIWATFNDKSMNRVCENAAKETGLGSPDTFYRILDSYRGKIDSRLMHRVQVIAASKNIPIPPALAVRPVSA